MTEQEKQLYIKTKERFRRLGKENPADVIIALAEEVECYRSKIGVLEKELDTAKVVNHLLEQDIADRDKMLEQKVEEVYPEFMRDYKAMLEEMEGLSEELGALIELNTPTKPIEETDAFGDRSVCCPHCLGPVTNYWVQGTKPKHCQFCGQALEWGEEGKQ